MSGGQPDPVATVARIGDLAAEVGLGRIHILAWRDLDDVESGGSEIHTDRVARLWVRAGIEVTMRTSHAAGAPDVARRNGYRVIRRAGRYMVFPRAAVAELAGRHGHRDGLVEIWNGMPFFTPVWARRPRAVWLHHAHTDMWPMVMGRFPAALGRALERDIAPRFYRRTPIVTLSESSRRHLIDRFRFRPDRVHAVAPGIDGLFQPGGSESTRPLLVAVARLMPHKHLDRVIRIGARLRLHHDLRLVIVGEGYERDRLDRLVADLDAGAWCELAGRVDIETLVGLYQQAWAVMSASISEGWGMTITEAAACATPAVVTGIPGHLDAVVDGVTGHVVDSEDEFVAALTRVITDPEHRRRLGEAAQRRAVALTWERTALDTLTVLAREVRPRR